MDQDEILIVKEFKETEEILEACEITDRIVFGSSVEVEKGDDIFKRNMSAMSIVNELIKRKLLQKIYVIPIPQKRSAI